MKYEGIVVSVTKNKAIVTTNDFQCFYIKRNPTIYIGKQIEFTEKDSLETMPFPTPSSLEADNGK